MIIKVSEADGYIQARGALENTNLLIKRSISNIYLRTDDPKQVYFEPVTYEDNAFILSQIRDYLTDSVVETGILDRVYYRSGWFDTKLNSLKFVSMLELLAGYKKNTLSCRDRRKVVMICKQLSISQNIICKSSEPISYADVDILELLL